jgi:beta-xylosidase
MTYTLLIFSFIAGTCYSQGGVYTNPVSDTIFIADPFVLLNDGTYYLYGTSAGDGFKYWTSENLTVWEEKGYAFRKTSNSWGKGSFWAPEVIKYDNKFYMVYSASGETMYGKGLRLCLAVSESPAGPFTDIHAPMFDLGFSCIDGHIFVDTDNKPYLYYEMVGAVGEHWNNKGYLWGMVMGVELSADLSRPLHEQKLCLYPDQQWEGPRSMKARSNEGMTVFKNKGVYYMTYSGNHYADPNYGVGYAVSDSPLGMWVKYENNPILKSDTTISISGPGHNSIIKSPDNKEWFIVYHSHANPDKPSGKRMLNIDRLLFNSDSTISVKGPTRTPQPLPSGSR